MQIDNTSYLNGQTNAGTTWELADLDDGQGPGPNGAYLFFNFSDVKPGDEGEDTVSLHVFDNDAWACVDLSITSDNDVDCTDPELVDDQSCDDPDGDDFDGELAGELNFLFWTDDGDNVYEEGETILTGGPASDVLNGVTWALADSDENNLGGSPGEPMTASNNYFIGKAWCFGTLTPDAVVADQGENPTVDSGVDCDGSGVDNASQTDDLVGDIVFRVEQARNNPNFQCVI